MNEPRFSNPSLQETFQKVSPAFDSYLERIDQISADIKELEKYLHAQGVVLEFRHVVNEASKDGGYVGSEALLWKHDNTSDKWRLFYEHTSWDEKTDTESTVEEKPLIETKAEIRRRTAHALPDFLKKLAEETAPIK
jgi:hypothetical protein